MAAKPNRTAAAVHYCIDAVLDAGGSLPTTTSGPGSGPDPHLGAFAAGKDAALGALYKAFDDEGREGGRLAGLDPGSHFVLIEIIGDLDTALSGRLGLDIRGHVLASGPTREAL